MNFNGLPPIECFYIPSCPILLVKAVVAPAACLKLNRCHCKSLHSVASRNDFSPKLGRETHCSDAVNRYSGVWKDNRCLCNATLGLIKLPR